MWWLTQVWCNLYQQPRFSCNYTVRVLNEPLYLKINLDLSKLGGNLQGEILIWLKRWNWNTGVLVEILEIIENIVGNRDERLVTNIFSHFVAMFSNSFFHWNAWLRCDFETLRLFSKHNIYRGVLPVCARKPFTVVSLPFLTGKSFKILASIDLWPDCTSSVVCNLNLYHLTHCMSSLILSHTTNFRLFQTERVCKRHFQIWWKWQKVLQKGRKHCGKRRNCSLRAISPFPTVFSKDLYCGHVKFRASLGKA